MYQEIRQQLVLKYGKVYLISCLCFDKKKLDRIQKASLLAQESEFLREDYMKILKNLKRIYNSGEIILKRNSLEKL